MDKRKELVKLTYNYVSNVLDLNDDTSGKSLQEIRKNIDLVADHILMETIRKFSEIGITVPSVKSWKQVDYMKYACKISEGVYECIQAIKCPCAKNSDGNTLFVIDEAMRIDLRRESYMYGDAFTSKAIDILKELYGSVSCFLNIIDPSEREMYLALAIYETNSIAYMGYDLVCRENAERILSHYMQTGDYLRL